MKAFHLTTYKIYRPQFAGLKVGLFSDVHFSTQVSDAKLAAIQQFFATRSVDYLLLAGDLVDSNDALDDPAEQRRLLRWLERLGTIAPVLYALGNHEFLRGTNMRHPRWYYEFNHDFFAKVAQTLGIRLLDNTHFQDKKLYAVGLTQNRDYYDFEFKREGSSYLHPEQENKSALLQTLAEQKSQLTNLPEKKLKFALIHSPVYLRDAGVRTELQEFDFVISGHMHNGVVPPVVNELIPSQKGIVAPAKQLLPSTARNTYKTYQDQLIVLGPVTTFHKCSGAFHHFNALYPTYLSIIEFTKDPKYKNKPYIGRKYLNW